jgi:ATP-binding protein involved in chromosome partitioning
MFERMKVPTLGIVENMSGFICPHCDEVTDIFGSGGAERFAKTHGLHYFGGIPLDVKVRQGGDAGVPAVAQREPGRAAEVMREVARAVAGRVSMQATTEAPTLTIT